MKAAWTLARRDLARYFTSPTGYVFIVVFIIFGSAAQFWQDQFFASNLANLAPLNGIFPYLLLFFVPAVAMGTWADERRQGTDELLLTLPLRDVEIVIGKYLAALGVYSVSLAFSLSHVIVLLFLGSPDAGLMFGTYLGYWLLGAALIPIAMIGSLLAESLTVGYILGALLCAVPVFLSLAGGFFGEAVASMGVQEPFSEFASGLVTARGVVYFVALAGLGLLINFYLVRRRRMTGRTWHLPVRTACAFVGATAFTVLAGRPPARLDVTAEGLQTLSPQTREIMRQIDPDRPVFIRAYISPVVPREYVETRETLLALLREFDAMGGERVAVQVYPTERASDASRDADEKYGIRPERIMTSEGGRSVRMDVWLGAAFSSGLDEVVIPFFYRGLSVEYELARSIRVVSRAQRRKVGIVATDAKWFGGFDFQSMRSQPPWEIVEELKRQYEVVQVAPDAALPHGLDAIVVPLPSSLPQLQMDRVLEWTREGKPTLLLDDPLPHFDPRVGANEAKAGRGMFAQRPTEPKGDARAFFEALGFSWNPSEILWQKWNPHPGLGELPAEIVFVGSGSGSSEPFNAKSDVSSGLQEMVLLFAGRVRLADVKGLSFVPLVRTGPQAGTVAYTNVWTSHPILGGGFNPRRELYYRIAMPPGESVPAAWVRGETDKGKINAIFVADLDFASDQFFELRRARMEGLHFDNVTFLLNCIDALAGDPAFIELRKRRPRHRTLERVEASTRKYEQDLREETEAAEERAEGERAAAQKRFDEKVKEIEDRKDLEETTKDIMLRGVRETEQRRLDVEKKRIDDDRDAAIARAESARDREVRAIQNRIKVMALLLPPVPAILVGLLALWYRIQRELEAQR